MVDWRMKLNRLCSCNFCFLPLHGNSRPQTNTEAMVRVPHPFALPPTTMSSPERQELINNAVAFLADPKVCCPSICKGKSINLTYPIPDSGFTRHPKDPVLGGQGAFPTGNRHSNETGRIFCSCSCTIRQFICPESICDGSSPTATLGLEGLLCKTPCNE